MQTRGRPSPSCQWLSFGWLSGPPQRAHASGRTPGRWLRVTFTHKKRTLCDQRGEPDRLLRSLRSRLCRWRHSGFQSRQRPLRLQVLLEDRVQVGTQVSPRPRIQRWTLGVPASEAAGVSRGATDRALAGASLSVTVTPRASRYSGLVILKMVTVWHSHHTVPRRHISVGGLHHCYAGSRIPRSLSLRYPLKPLQGRPQCPCVSRLRLTAAILQSHFVLHSGPVTSHPPRPPPPAAGRGHRWRRVSPRLAGMG